MKTFVLKMKFSTLRFNELSIQIARGNVFFGHNYFNGLNFQKTSISLKFIKFTPQVSKIYPYGVKLPPAEKPWFKVMSTAPSSVRGRFYLLLPCFAAFPKLGEAAAY